MWTVRHLDLIKLSTAGGQDMEETNFNLKHDSLGRKRQSIRSICCVSHEFLVIYIFISVLVSRNTAPDIQWNLSQHCNQSERWWPVRPRVWSVRPFRHHFIFLFSPHHLSPTVTLSLTQCLGGENMVERSTSRDGCCHWYEAAGWLF